jgi:hypothetical protein
MGKTYYYVSDGCGYFCFIAVADFAFFLVAGSGFYSYLGCGLRNARIQGALCY